MEPPDAIVPAAAETMPREGKGMAFCQSRPALMPSQRRCGLQTDKLCTGRSKGGYFGEAAARCTQSAPVTAIRITFTFTRTKVESRDFLPLCALLAGSGNELLALCFWHTLSTTLPPTLSMYNPPYK